ncbi:hypothetical protein N7493_010774 [Penicillium malachiteum]|uniref:Uncharacterized protein n=1 Tax=Penicillium malachiteum TaxID=1324776 RepID=A0AAD6HDK4_9EURO|nr:hypothetical protein N7493_010774 [Penicillium malachiteum]
MLQRNCQLSFSILNNFNQENLENGAASTMTAEDFESTFLLMQKKMRENIEKCLFGTGADVIMASGESLLPTVAMAAGYSIAALPLGFTKAIWSGGSCKGWRRGYAFQVMSAWEATVPEAIKPPPMLTSV